MHRQITAGISVCLAVVAVGPAPAVAANAESGGLIAFEANGVYVMDTEGDHVRDITGFAGDDHSMWSPDGSRLAFTSIRDRSPGDSGHDIYVVEVSTRSIRRVTYDSSGGPPTSWSADGRFVVYVSGEDGAIYTVEVDTGRKAQITEPTVDQDDTRRWYDSPSFSPDGTRIAYAELSTEYVSTGGWPPRALPVTSGAIFVVDSAGTNPVRLTSGVGSAGAVTKWTDHDRFPTWSPSGDTIAFISDADSSAGSDLYTIEPDGSGRTRLTIEADVRAGAAWAPDGSELVYVTDTAAFMVASGGGPSTMIGVGDMPSWAADGTRLVYTGADGVTIVDRDGSNPVLVVPAGFEADRHVRDAKWQPVFPPIGLVDTATGVWRLRDWGGRAATFYYGDPGDVPFVGDWDCDGDDTPGLFRRSDAFVYLRNSTTQGTADVRFFFGNPSDVPVPGDFDGDGCDTVSLYRPAEQRFYIINRLGTGDGGLGAADVSFSFGDPGDTPVVGDWDGDGLDEVALHRMSTGSFYWRDAPTTGVADGVIVFGDPGDRMLAGDWGAVDGFESPAVFRPSSSTFHFRDALTSGAANSSVTWLGARSDWLPVSGPFVLD